RSRGRPLVAFTGRNGATRTSLSEINITALVDVVLVLLVIFMLTAPVLQSGIEVNVPKTKTVHEITQQRMVVTINKDQEVFLEDKPVNLADLPSLLSKPGVNPADQVIYVEADERVPFGAFASVMDAVKQAGITHISIVTQPTRKGAASHTSVCRDAPHNTSPLLILIRRPWASRRFPALCCSMQALSRRLWSEASPPGSCTTTSGA